MKIVWGFVFQHLFPPRKGWFRFGFLSHRVFTYAFFDPDVVRDMRKTREADHARKNDREGKRCEVRESLDPRTLQFLRDMPLEPEHCRTPYWLHIGGHLLSV